MAPRRHPTTGGGGGGGGNSSHQLDVHNLLGLSAAVAAAAAVDSSNNESFDSSIAGQSQQQQQCFLNTNTESNYTRCCVPSGDCYKSGCIDYGLINLEDLHDCIRVICNNENCTAGQYMHRECFDTWEQGVLSYLKSIGRARSWSDRQRHQNLWSKKGYDLVFKACGCKCGRGHLKKDLDWSPPMQMNIFGRIEEDASKKKKKRNRNNQKPALQLTTSAMAQYSNGCMPSMAPIELRTRTGSLSSSNGSSSPPASGSSDHSVSPVHTGSVVSAAAVLATNKKPKSKVEAYSERVR